MNYSSFLLDDIKKADTNSIPEILRYMSTIGYDDYEIIDYLGIDEEVYEEIVYFDAPISSKDVLLFRAKLASFVRKNPPNI